MTMAKLKSMFITQNELDQRETSVVTRLVFLIQEVKNTALKLKFQRVRRQMVLLPISCQSFLGTFYRHFPRSIKSRRTENNVSNHNFCLTTGDAMLANMFVFMCSHGSPSPVTPKLWLVLSAQQRSFLYGMNDILQVGSAAPTRVINVPNTNIEVSSGSNRSNSNSRQRNTTPVRMNTSNNRREGSGNSNNMNARPGFFGRAARFFGGNKKQNAKSNSTQSPKFKPQTPRVVNNKNIVRNNNNSNTRSFVTASSNNSSNNNNNVTQPVKKRKVNNNVQAKLKERERELARLKERERELARLKKRERVLARLKN